MEKQQFFKKLIIKKKKFMERKNDLLQLDSVNFQSPSDSSFLYVAFKGIKLDCGCMCLYMIKKLEKEKKEKKRKQNKKTKKEKILCCSSLYTFYYINFINKTFCSVVKRSHTFCSTQRCPIRDLKIGFIVYGSK